MMTIKEFKQTEICKKAKRVIYLDVNGVNISRKPSFILDMLTISGVSHCASGDIVVYVMYEEWEIAIKQSF